jgi:hypothetical protein
MSKGLKWPLIVLAFGVLAVAVIGHDFWLPYIQEVLNDGSNRDDGVALTDGGDPSLDEKALRGQEDEAEALADKTRRRGKNGGTDTEGSGSAADGATSGADGESKAGGSTSGDAVAAGDTAKAEGAAKEEVPVPEPVPVPIETVEGQQINPNLTGGLGEVSSKRIGGWVKDKFEPETALYVKIEIDDKPCYEFKADKREEHKTEGVIWRFDVPEPSELQDTERHVVRALVYRKDQHGKTELGGSPRVKTTGNYPQGKLEEATPENGITGYAWDPDTTAKPVRVIVRIDGETISELKADVKNEELKTRKIAPIDTCAFSVAWPNQLDDGNEHTVQVFAVDNEAGTEHEIDGSPRVVGSRSGLENAAPVGGFDICNKVVLAGWAYDPDAGTGAVDVEIWIDNELFAQIPANSKRETLFWARMTPDAFHGFITTTPTSLLDGLTHTVRVYALNHPSGVKVEVDGSPRQYRMEENTEPMGGFWAGTDNILHGWAADPDLNTEPCDLEIYIDGKLWERQKANRFESWLVGSGFAPNPEHGFLITPPESTRDGLPHAVQILAINSPEGPPKNLGTLTIGVNSTFAGFWTSDKLLDTRISKGLYVSGVSPWYDAYHKDVKVGDVLLEYGGIIAGTAEVKDKDGKVTTEGTMSAHYNAWLTKNKKQGDVVRYKFWRDGETYEVDITMGVIVGR